MCVQEEKEESEEEGGPAGIESEQPKTLPFLYSSLCLCVQDASERRIVAAGDAAGSAVSYQRRPGTV